MLYVAWRKRTALFVQFCPIKKCSLSPLVSFGSFFRTLAVDSDLLVDVNRHNLSHAFSTGECFFTWLFLSTLTVSKKTYLQLASVFPVWLCVSMVTTYNVRWQVFFQPGHAYQKSQSTRKYLQLESVFRAWLSVSTVTIHYKIPSAGKCISCLAVC